MRPASGSRGGSAARQPAVLRNFIYFSIREPAVAPRKPEWEMKKKPKTIFHVRSRMSHYLSNNEVGSLYVINFAWRTRSDEVLFGILFEAHSTIA